MIGKAKPEPGRVVEAAKRQQKAAKEMGAMLNSLPAQGKKKPAKR